MAVVVTFYNPLITVLERQGWKEFQPVDDYSGHTLHHKTTDLNVPVKDVQFQSISVN